MNADERGSEKSKPQRTRRITESKEAISQNKGAASRQRPSNFLRLLRCSVFQKILVSASPFQISVDPR
jgi:hypothetical protein